MDNGSGIVLVLTRWGAPRHIATKARLLITRQSEWWIHGTFMTLFATFGLAPQCWARSDFGLQTKRRIPS